MLCSAFNVKLIDSSILLVLMSSHFPGRSGLCEKSLAEEIEDVSGAADEDTDKRPGEKTRDSEILELKARLSSQKDVNRQLQTYIDAVILNIMEKNPELLEVSKQN